MKRLNTMMVALPLLLAASAAGAAAVNEPDGTMWQRIDDSVTNDYAVNCTEGVQPVYYYAPARDVDMHTAAGKLVEIQFRRDSSEMPMNDRFQLSVGTDVTCRIGRMSPTS